MSFRTRRREGRGLQAAERAVVRSPGEAPVVAVDEAAIPGPPYICTGCPSGRPYHVLSNFLEHRQEHDHAAGVALEAARA